MKFLPIFLLFCFLSAAAILCVHAGSGESWGYVQVRPSKPNLLLTLFFNSNSVKQQNPRLILSSLIFPSSKKQKRHTCSGGCTRALKVTELRRVPPGPGQPFSGSKAAL
ncbi:hypothetical protein QQ045_003131 [Rhodiola kirilowii]